MHRDFSLGLWCEWLKLITILPFLSIETFDAHQCSYGLFKIRYKDA